MSHDFTKRTAKDLICQFFDKEWPHVDPEELMIEKIGEGYCNTVHIVKRKNASSKEPAAVIVRQNGGNQLDMTCQPSKNSDLEEMLVVNEMSRRGWGAKLYGVFPGGRIEEYIECATLTPNDCKDSSLRKAVAKSLARFHSMELPLSRTKISLLLSIDTSVDPETKNLICDHLRNERPDLLDKAETILEWDTIQEKEWLLENFEKKKYRKSLMVLDTNYTNILVRKNVSNGEPPIVLVDYEFAMYGYSCVDLGGFCVMRTMDSTNTQTCTSGSSYPGEDEIRSLVEEYLKECKSLGTVAPHEDTDYWIEASQYGALMMIILMIDITRNVPEAIFTKTHHIVFALAEMHNLYHDIKGRLCNNNLEK